MAVLKCTGCEKEIDCCTCCEEETCDAPICFECLVVEVGQSAGPTYKRGRAAAPGRSQGERR